MPWPPVQSLKSKAVSHPFCERPQAIAFEISLHVEFVRFFLRPTSPWLSEIRQKKSKSIGQQTFLMSVYFRFFSPRGGLRKE